MVAALLDLQKCAGSALEAVDQMRRGLFEVRRLEPWRAIALRQQFRAVVEHPVDLRHCGVALWSDLGGAAGDDDLRLGMPAASPADRLSRLPLGFGGDGAGIDDDGALSPGLGRARRMTSDSNAFSRQPKVTISFPSMLGSTSGEECGIEAPSKLSAAGPVMITCPSSRHWMSRLPPSSVDRRRGVRRGRGDARRPARRRRRCRRPG